MANANFYNWAENVAYPFLRYTPFIPDSTIVSCGFILGPGTGFRSGTHTVFLTRVIREGGTLYFDFASNAPGLVGKHLRFSRSISDSRYVNEYADSLTYETSSISASIAGVDCDVIDDFLGFLVTGDLAAIMEILPNDGLITGTATVEPALLQVLTDSFARSVNLANGDRTRYATPEDCKPQCWPTDPQPMYIQATCLRGPLKFVGGFNTAIRQNSINNSLTFDAAVGAGAGQVCDQPALFAGETAPDDSNFLEGGPGCGEVVRSINGVGGRLIDLLGGQGTTITAEPNKSRITVDLNTNDMMVCAQTEGNLTDIDDCPPDSLSADSCGCGAV